MRNFFLLTIYRRKSRCLTGLGSRPGFLMPGKEGSNESYFGTTSPPGNHS